MNNIEEIKKIKKRLDKLENKSERRSYYEEQIVKASIQIIRIKTFKYYIKDNGDTFYFSKHDDTRGMLKYFQSVLENAAEQILIEQTKE